jgi:hypothetical protein
MEGWQWFVVWFMPMVGAGIGGYLGYLAKSTQPFVWKKQIATLAAGLVGGLLWLWMVKDMAANWSAGVLVGGALVGIGFDFLFKKFPSPS